MDISGVLFPYFLRDHSYANCRFNTKKVYQSISIPATDTGMLSPGTVYVCLLSEALAIGSSVNEISFICIQDRLLSDPEIDELENILLIKENISLGNLFSSLTSEINALQKWTELSNQALLKGCKYQDLLDLAESVIHESIYVMNSTFKLLANSKSYPCPDPITVSLEKYGYHTEETIKLFRRNNSLERFTSSSDFIIDEPDPAQFPTITKCFGISEKVELVVTLVSFKEEISDHLLELFKILCGFINICFINTFKNHYEINSPTELMLNRILYEENNDPFYASELARANNFSLTGAFVLFRIIYEDNPNVLINKAVDQFRGLLPDAHIFSHNYEITMLVDLSDKKTDEQIQTITAKLEAPLKKHHMLCGVSSVFENIHQIRTASDNATTALSFGQFFFQHGKFFNIPENIWIQFTRILNERFYYYDSLLDFICISWFMAEHEILPTDSTNKIKWLIQYDEQHNSFLTLILLCYLMNGKRATDTGNMLFTHRNNIVYSIHKISNLLSVDLDGPGICENLMAGFQILAVATANKEAGKTNLIV